MEQRSTPESSNAFLEYITGFIQLAERHPLGFLVIMLIAAIIWLARRLDKVAKEKQQMALSLYAARTQHGHEFDEDTTRVMNTVNRRKKPRK